jgi:hypothetical protein
MSEDSKAPCLLENLAIGVKKCNGMISPIL